MPDAYAQPTTEADRAIPGPLASYTTLRMGGPAERIVAAGSADEIVRAVRAADEPVLILAGGSNVVIGDAGFPGTVVLVRSRGLRVVAEDAASVTVRVDAGEPWDDLVAATVANGWAGLECLSGIPGSTGATPIQNVGAYGQEVAETITGVEVYDRVDGTRQVIPAADCGFAYRGSVFKYDGPLRGALGRLPARPVAAVRRRCATPSWPGRSVSRSATRCRWRTPGRRCCGCAPARAWCSTPTTRTPARSAPSSPTRCSTGRRTTLLRDRAAELATRPPGPGPTAWSR